jgi:hypothetical protein
VSVGVRGQAATGAQDLLVALDLLVEGRYYYGCVVGLTDGAGRAVVSRPEVEAQFALDQRTFPMDYRVSLEQCDPVATVRVTGGKEFAEQHAKGGASGLVAPATAARWRRARNAAFRSASAPVQLVGGSRAAVTLTLDVQGAA